MKSTVVSSKRPHRRPSPRGDGAGRFRGRWAFRIFVVASVLLAAAVVFLLRWRLNWPLWLAYLIAINLTTFMAYLYDKRAAGYGRMRVPEKLLHLLSALGGSPAALLGQLALRHKTRKRSFLAWFWAIVILQAVSIAAYLYW